MTKPMTEPTERAVPSDRPLDRLLPTERAVPAEGAWAVAPEVCRRENCTAVAIGRGLCARHYARWHNELDELNLPGDKAPAPEPVWWTPPRLD